MIVSHNFYVSYTCLEQTTHVWIEVFISMSYMIIKYYLLINGPESNFLTLLNKTKEYK